MAAVISLRAETDRGVEILEELDRRTEVRPQQILEDKTRRYYLEARDADIDAFDRMLEKIEPDWRSHVNNWTPRRNQRGFLRPRSR
jgi:hypothetical protein